jgi:cytochrome c-type biogenesis protein CcmE
MSKKLDDELAQAAGLGSEDSARPSTRPSAPPTAVAVADKPRKETPKASTNLGLLATLLVMVGALVALFMVGFKDAAIYAKPVDQLLAQKSELIGRKVRVEGELVPGSLEKRDKPCEYRFTLHGKEKKETLSVRYPQCIVPDTFRDVPGGGVQVTIEGTLKSANDFEATLVMAKCSSKYDAEKHEMKPVDGLPVN